MRKVSYVTKLGFVALFALFVTSSVNAEAGVQNKDQNTGNLDSILDPNNKNALKSSANLNRLLNEANSMLREIKYILSGNTNGDSDLKATTADKSKGNGNIQKNKAQKAKSSDTQGATFSRKISESSIVASPSHKSKAPTTSSQIRLITNSRVNTQAALGTPATHKGKVTKIVPEPNIQTAITSQITPEISSMNPLALKEKAIKAVTSSNIQITADIPVATKSTATASVNRKDTNRKEVHQMLITTATSSTSSRSIPRALAIGTAVGGKRSGPSLSIPALTSITLSTSEVSAPLSSSGTRNGSKMFIICFILVWRLF